MLTLRNQTIKVNKNILLAKIKENLELYKLDYSETLQDYHLAIKKHLEKAIASVNEGNYSSDVIYFRINAPVDYIEKYQTVIDMLEYSTNEEIELDSPSFKAYIKNQWDWTDSFKAYSTSLKGQL